MTLEELTKKVTTRWAERGYYVDYLTLRLVVCLYKDGVSIREECYNQYAQRYESFGFSPRRSYEGTLQEAINKHAELYGWSTDFVVDEENQKITHTGAETKTFEVEANTK